MFGVYFILILGVIGQIFGYWALVAVVAAIWLFFGLISYIYKCEQEGKNHSS